MHIRAFQISPLRSNCYVVAESEGPGSLAVIVDPGDEGLEDVFDYIDDCGLKVEAVWCTHAHFDHILGVDVARAKYQVPAYVHRDDEEVWKRAPQIAAQFLGANGTPLAPPDGYWSDNDILHLGTTEWVVWHTPGHSPGSVCLIGPEFTLTGDTLFAGAIGRVDFPDSDAKAMMTSLERLQTLPDTTRFYAGHGWPSTIGKERQSNPFFNGGF